MKILIYLTGIMASMTFTVAETPVDSSAPAAPPVAKKVHTENHINGAAAPHAQPPPPAKANPHRAKYPHADNPIHHPLTTPGTSPRHKGHARQAHHPNATAPR